MLRASMDVTLVRSACSALLLSSLVTSACRVPVRVEKQPDLASRCSRGVCVEVVSFLSHRPTVGVWIEAPPATRLVNAHFIAGEAPPCGGHLPVAWVTVDQEIHRTGPVEVGGKHGVVLGFPINAWWGQSGYWGATFVDVEFEVGGVSRCVRSRLTRADGQAEMGL